MRLGKWKRDSYELVRSSWTRRKEIITYPQKYYSSAILSIDDKEKSLAQMMIRGRRDNMKDIDVGPIFCRLPPQRDYWSRNSIGAKILIRISNSPHELLSIFLLFVLRLIFRSCRKITSPMCRNHPGGGCLLCPTHVHSGGIVSTVCHFGFILNGR